MVVVNRGGEKFRQTEAAAPGALAEDGGFHVWMGSFSGWLLGNLRHAIKDTITPKPKGKTKVEGDESGSDPRKLSWDFGQSRESRVVFGLFFNSWMVALFPVPFPPESNSFSLRHWPSKRCLNPTPFTAAARARILKISSGPL